MFTHKNIVNIDYKTHRHRERERENIPRLRIKYRIYRLGTIQIDISLMSKMSNN